MWSPLPSVCKVWRGAVNKNSYVALTLTPWLIEEGVFIHHHSLHCVCVQGCRLPDVWDCGLGSVWAGVSTFTFAPGDLYWGDRKHTSVKLSRVILYEALPVWSVCKSQWWVRQLASMRLQVEPNACIPTAMSKAGWSVRIQNRTRHKLIPGTAINRQKVHWLSPHMLC